MTTKRPSKNTNGQSKKPSANPDGGPAPQLAPSAAHTGVNPLTHPNHPDMQAAAAAAAGGVKQTQVLPEGGNPNPGGTPAGVITPTPTDDTRQVRENINFHDLSPVEQSQAAQQQGLDPYAPMHMLQQQAQGALAAGPTPAGSPVPNTLLGPMTPPGVESFPDDMAHLQLLMKQGYAPGATPQEHALAQNSHAILRSRDASAQAQGDGTGPMPSGPLPQQTIVPPQQPQAPAGPPLPSAAGAPPAQGGPPPGIADAIMAAMQRRKRPV